VLFEIGKFYRHNDGEEIAILGELETTMYGKCLVAESSRSMDLKPVGNDASCTANFHEITKKDWMKNFST